MSKDKIEKLASALDLAGYEIVELTGEHPANEISRGGVTLRLVNKPSR
jgi:hypothetical protein